MIICSSYEETILYETLDLNVHCTFNSLFSLYVYSFVIWKDLLLGTMISCLLEVVIVWFCWEMSGESPIFSLYSYFYYYRIKYLTSITVVYLLSTIVKNGIKNKFRRRVKFALNIDWRYAWLDVFFTHSRSPSSSEKKLVGHRQEAKSFSYPSFLYVKSLLVICII